MPSLVPLALLLVALSDPPAAAADPPSPLDLVAALESVLADAIAKAEPSVVAIAREERRRGRDDCRARPSVESAAGIAPPVHDPG